jgi:hypothetical protein
MIFIKRISIVSAKILCSAIIAVFLSLFLEVGCLYADTEHSLSVLLNVPSQQFPSEDPRQKPGPIFYAEAQPLGEGSMYAWVKFDNDGNPSDIGVSLTERALYGLPKQTDEFEKYPLKLNLQDGIGFATFEYEIPLPKEVSTAPFTHISFNINPYGHAPHQVYDTEHFDFHFNLITPSERYAIRADNYDSFAALAYKHPPEEFLPPGYKTVHRAAEPRMGTHWFDFEGSEFHGGHWDKSFNIGSYNGEITFWEPMISVPYLATKPNITIPIKQPFAYPKSGYYPTHYSINHANGEYSVSLNGLQFRPAKLAENSNSLENYADIEKL